jgi:hypothetical protein
MPIVIHIEADNEAQFDFALFQMREMLRISPYRPDINYPPAGGNINDAAQGIETDPKLLADLKQAAQADVSEDKPKRNTRKPKAETTEQTAAVQNTAPAATAKVETTQPSVTAKVETTQPAPEIAAMRDGLRKKIAELMEAGVTPEEVKSSIMEDKDVSEILMRKIRDQVQLFEAGSEVGLAGALDSAKGL